METVATRTTPLLHLRHTPILLHTRPIPGTPWHTSESLTTYAGWFASHPPSPTHTLIRITPSPHHFPGWQETPTLPEPTTAPHPLHLTPHPAPPLTTRRRILRDLLHLLEERTLLSPDDPRFTELGFLLGGPPFRHLLTPPVTLEKTRTFREEVRTFFHILRHTYGLET
ncbi:hypothetical protein [Spirochaeta thermophila]|uniref:hypothetical protein n=1 Tax=Winmispira thermophila TaxID=154 RepID=UPI0002F79726|nr:hypothetical protein [Spirochaeta thermophila]